MDVTDNQGNLIEKELEDNQKHKIKLTENEMNLAITYGIDFVDNDIDWGYFIKYSFLVVIEN